MQVSLAGVPGVEKRRLGADRRNKPSRVRRRATRRLRELTCEVAWEVTYEVPGEAMENDGQSPRQAAIQRARRFSSAGVPRRLHGILARFPLRAEAAHGFAQTNGQSCNRFETLWSAVRQAPVVFAPYFGEQKFRVS